MVKPKDSIALSKMKKKKNKADFKSLRNSRKNVIRLVVITIILSLIYISYELYMLISDELKIVVKIINISTVIIFYFKSLFSFS